MSSESSFEQPRSRAKTQARTDQTAIYQPAFVVRLNRLNGIAGGLVALGGGMYGCHQQKGMSWLNAFLHSATIFGGMESVNPLHTDPGKLFAGCYALFSGWYFWW